jgi:nitroreductase/NAD-dependent dihydropyrimidine dehydrogenase PreA subunit
MPAPVFRAVTTVIDPDKCTGCGRCVPVCPSRTLSMVDGKAQVTGKDSLSCGHCAAACPAGAITVGALDPSATTYSTFQADSRWLPFGKADVEQLVRLMGSRRSCRNFKPRPVDRRYLEDLVKVGATAPSGTNSQRWSFTIVNGRQAVMGMGAGIARLLKGANWLAERDVARLVSKVLPGDPVGAYWRDYHDSIVEGLREWETGGRERLFHGAPAAICIGSLPGASTPAEDALLAAQNMQLAAHAMGLGTCLIGFAVAAMKLDPRIKRAVGIPWREPVYAVLAVGWPDERWHTVAGRLPIPMRVFEK